jgi:hypothetical protein
MGLRVEYCLFADKAIVEQGTGKMTLVGIFQSATSEMEIIPTMAMYCRLHGEPGKYDLKVQVTHVKGGVDGKDSAIMPELPLSITLGSKGAGQLMFNIVGLPIAGNSIRFDIYEGENHLHSSSIPIQQTEVVSNAGNNE